MSSPAPLAAPDIIRVRDLRKMYHVGDVDVHALRGVDLDVERGEFLAVIGPSGSGKSTLFHILGGLAPPTSGEIWIDGVDLRRMTENERTVMRQKKVGFVFQKYNLLPTLTARDNVEIAYEISARREPLDMGYLSHLTDMLGISGRLDHRPSELSGGEQQRIAIARALITHPAIVLADEPTGNLDSKNSEAVLSMLQRSNRELKQTVLMITHNPEAAAIGDRILHMLDGKIVGIEPGHGRTDASREFVI